MVNSDNEIQVLKNGGKSQPNSPITLTAPSGKVQGSESSEDEREGQIRVGRDYQAVPPPFIPKIERRPDQCPERALLVWSPSTHISNQKLDEFIQVAKEKYGYNAEQALGMLFWHKHDLDRALQDLSNFTPFPDEWSVEDKVLFEQAFQFHGKSFHRIRQMLPDKSIAALVKYYYSWKKTRTRTSLMDRQARKLVSAREDGGYGEENFPEAGVSDEEDKEGAAARCANCGIPAHTTYPTNDKLKAQLCGTCHQFWTRTGQMRPTTGPMRKDGVKPKHAIFRNSSQPPKGMHINHDDLVGLATGPVGQGEALLRAHDREIVSYKRLVQNNKQSLASLRGRRKARDRECEPYRVPEAANRINARWTNEELLLAVQGVRKFGKNFATIASILGTKTDSHVRSFFVNYKKRYNLDVVYKEYEAEFGSDSVESEDVKEDSNGITDKDSDNSPKTSLPNSPRSKSPASGSKVNGTSK